MQTRLAWVLVALAAAGCGASGPSAPGGVVGPTDPGSPNKTNVIANDGVASFDALSADDRQILGGHGVYFLHKSVGEDMVTGSEAEGIKWGYAGVPADFDEKQLGSGLYEVPNGNPLEKIAEFQAFVTAAGVGLELATMKFGYADIEATKDLGAVRARYGAMVQSLKAKRPGLRILHVTPALTLGGGGDVGQNKTRGEFAAWMRSQYSATAIVFDLQVLESTAPDGTTCMKDGAARLCEQYRYAGGGPNGPADNDSQGHLSPPAARRVAKAFLFAIHRAFALPAK